MAADALVDLLDCACTAFEQREEEAALACLLPVWRETRAERVAALVERLSARLTARQAPLEYMPVAPSVQLPRPWELSRRLEALREAARSGRAAELAEQLDALRRWPADPRLTPALLDVARLSLAHEERVGNELGGLLMYVRDPRAIEGLQAIRAALDSGSPLAQRLLTVIDLTDSQEVSALSPEALGRCDALAMELDAREAAEVRSTSLRESLLARIHAHPDDVGARLVLADLLLDLGDPLGEFIMLQCAPEPDPARVKALRMEHLTEWQASLGPAVEPLLTRFERGFPVAVQMRLDRKSPPPPPPEPAWGTVEEIDWNWRGSPEVAAWLAHPNLHGVKRLRHVWAGLGQRLGEYPLPVRRLELQGQLAVRAPNTFSVLGALPHLTWVELPDARASDVLLCAASPLARRLERFEARVEKAWTLVVTPPGEVLVEVPRLGGQQRGELVEVIRAAVGFGARVLRLRALEPLDGLDLRELERAGSGYERVEWTSR